MRRIRIALALVALGLVVPMAVLVKRALEGLAYESAVRHETVAERAFDEMERALSQFLRVEEERPFDHYRFYLDPSPAGVPLRSPLADPPQEPFVVAYFQVDPDGSVYAPRQPRDLERARAAGDWPPPAGEQETIARSAQRVRELWNRAQRQDALAQLASEPLPQAPGSTLSLGRATTGKRTAAAGAEAQAEEEFTAYDLLQSFNRAVEERAERRQKVEQAPAASVYGALAPAEEFADAFGADPESPPRAGREAAAEADRATPAAPSPTSLDQRGPEGAAPQRAAKRDALNERTVRVVLDPMVGRLGEADQLLLYRTVLIGQQGYRQGLLVDLRALARWLEDRVIAASGLGGVARTQFLVAGEAAPRGDTGYAYQHRFAEPFDGLAVQLRFTALPGVGSRTPVYALAGLALLVGVSGLFAVYRMVAVVVHFAERRSNFVAAVSHELKTPLTAIRMYGEMLRDGLVGSETKRDEYYRTITDETERLSRLINNVLEFSRLEKGAREMQLVVGAIGPVLQEAADKLRPHAEREGFTLHVDVEPGLPPLRIDVDGMLQVLFNLVDNAMKYARSADRREVRLEACRRGDRICVGVRDYGPGVPRRHLRRIFEPFYRGEDELTRRAKGTGIGLALVRELGERMGAAVSGTNAEGGGFRVALHFRPAQT